MTFLSRGGPELISRAAVEKWRELYPDFNIDEHMRGLCQWLYSRPEKRPEPGAANMECYLGNCLDKRWRQGRPRGEGGGLSGQPRMRRRAYYDLCMDRILALLPEKAERPAA